MSHVTERGHSGKNRAPPMGWRARRAAQHLSEDKSVTDAIYDAG
jgi:hypothetical protein